MTPVEFLVRPAGRALRVVAGGTLVLVGLLMIGGAVWIVVASSGWGRWPPGR